MQGFWRAVIPPEGRNLRGMISQSLGTHALAITALSPLLPSFTLTSPQIATVLARSNYLLSRRCSNFLLSDLPTLAPAAPLPRPSSSIDQLPTVRLSSVCHRAYCQYTRDRSPNHSTTNPPRVPPSQSK